MNWNLLIASIAVIFSMASYLFTRRKELAWKRSEFLCSQLQYLESDSDLVKALTVLEGWHPEITIADVFDDNSCLDDDKRLDYRIKFDKLLSFFWRLCYFYLVTKTISRTEVEGFGWYFALIADSPVLLAYCEDNGFVDINTVIKKLRFDQPD